ncbi:hypothetical protein ACOSP7_013632 [Xanthoceras sorbifolium]
MVKLLEDMIIEILSILPVKSLIRFRYVSKSWYVLVRSSSFISKHLKNDHNIHLISSLQNFSPQIPLSGLFLGPFDGILCIIKDGITLYNIATKELRTLPQIKASFHSHGVCLVFIGFGSVKNVKGSHIVEVYTLNSDSWRNVKGSNSNIDQYSIRQEHHIYFNRACYWVARNKITKDMVIFLFHLGNEKSKEISKMPMHIVIRFSLGLYNESLAILHLDFDVTKGVDIWVLNQGRWIKQLTVGTFIDGQKTLGF